MIRLNKMTDYAVVMLCHMARDGQDGGGKVVTAAQIAEDSGVPAPTVSKLMKQLSKAGILASHRGAGGGYSLDRGADGVTVAEVVTALEGPIALTACIDGADTSCGSMPACSMSGNWNQVNAAIKSALDSVTLADMMPRPFAFEPAPDELKSELKKRSQQIESKPVSQIGKAL